MPIYSRLQELLQDGALRAQDIQELERTGGGRVVLEALRHTPARTPGEVVEHRFRELVDSAPVLVWQTDERGAVFMNRAYRDFVCKPLQDLLAMGWASALHPQDADGYLSAYRAAYERRARFEAQFRFRRYDGEYRWLKTVGLPRSEAGEFCGYIGCSFDITDIKAAERALQERERWFADIVDVSPGILWVTDAQGRCTYLSRRWYELTGQCSDGGRDRGWLEATHPEDRAHTGAAFERALQDRSGLNFEYRLRLRDGSYGWFLDQGEPHVDEEGSFLGHVGHVIDISQRKQAELEKQQAGLLLQEANRRKDEFLATLAHELRNPLAPLSAGLHILRAAPSSPAAARAMPVMERQLAGMVRLIDDLMDLARITRGRIELQKEQADLRLLVERARETAQALFDERDQVLEMALPSAPVAVEADPVRITQVITNLLTNASRYSSPGSRVALMLEVADDGAQASVAVCDTGVGIPCERLDAVFEMFSPLNAELGRGSAGLGIGLAFARRLAQMHGGTLSAQSDGLGEGSTFTLVLPLTQPA
ncbi:PAS domain-containing sensor histidine kinase [Ramlibacter sp. AN1015]|uniref:sensor histidine kinase n=1 Tax=Ramlibacter sp. AN1015 TaxID=3133428 RepID=UPI0030C07934